MTSFEYTGETENISKRQLDFISEVLKKNGCHEKQVAVSNVGKIGDNYGSHAKRISTKKDSGEIFKMIAKIAPSSNDQKQVNNFFSNEILMYTEVLPTFCQLQEIAGIAERDKLTYPVCYGTLSETKNEMILLEDLDLQNYVMLDKMQPLSDSAVRIALQNLANFHSMSYVLKNREPKTYDRFQQTIGNAMTNSETMARSQMLFEAMAHELKSQFKDTPHSAIINDTIQHLIKSGLNIMTADRGTKYSLILHGDLWTNNIMFQMQGDKPKRCVLIDYQLSRHSLPPADLHNLLFCCTDYATRSKHYNEWIDLYHSELDRYLHNFGMKANYIYPRDKFDADMKRYGKSCLGISFVMINLLQRQNQDIPDMSIFENDDVIQVVEGLGINNLMEQTVDKIKERVGGLVESCLELGYVTEVDDRAHFE